MFKCPLVTKTEYNRVLSYSNMIAALHKTSRNPRNSFLTEISNKTEIIRIKSFIYQTR